MSKPKVAILGFGPSGAFAAKAAGDAGADVTIFCTKESLVIPPGSFWLHWVPDDVTEMFSPVRIGISGIGSEEIYFQKQWGVPFDKSRSTSFPKQYCIEIGYDPLPILKVLPDKGCKFVPLTQNLTDSDIENIAYDLFGEKVYDVIFQTFPRYSDIIYNPPLVPYWIARGEKDNVSGIYQGLKNWVVYNGEEHNVIVREAHLFGYHYVEFPKNMTIGAIQSVPDIDTLSGYRWIQLKDLSVDTIPLRQDPKAYIYMVGRFAEWDRKKLSHDTYQTVHKIVSEL